MSLELWTCPIHRLLLRRCVYECMLVFIHCKNKQKKQRSGDYHHWHILVEKVEGVTVIVGFESNN